MSRVVIAPDSFKSTLSASAVSEAIAQGWRRARPDDSLTLLPMADGGEGTLDAFAVAIPAARRMPVEVDGPAGGRRGAHWLLLPGGVGVVELAGTSGIELLGGRLAPLDAHTAGFGQAVRAALEHGVDSLVLGIGSSASTDGGLGVLRELGWNFLDAEGMAVPPGARGLLAVDRVDSATSLPLPAGGVRVLSDVTSPLTGPQGAAAVFGPQKGLAPGDIPEVDAALERLAVRLGVDPRTPGAGAAGGTGAALVAWGAELVAGAAEVARLVDLENAVAGADLVVTGEGAFDAQSLRGKAPGLVADEARRLGVPVALVAGQVAADIDRGPFADVVSLVELAGSAELAIAEPRRWLEAAGRRLAAIPW